MQSVTVDCDGNLVTFTDGQVRTYKQIKAELRQQGVLGPEQELVISSSGAVVGDEEVTWDDKLTVRPLHVSIRIQDLGSSQEFNVRILTPISEIRAIAERSWHAISRLTHNGRQVQDSFRIGREVPVDATLVGCLKVAVEDPNLGVRESVLVHENETVEDVQQRFCSQLRRPYPPNATLSLDGEELSRDLTMHEARVQDGSVLEFLGPEFPIRVKEGQSQPVELYVHDHFTGEQIKELYSAKADETLGANDRLYLNDVEFDDATPVYKYGVKMGSVLMVHREDVAQIVTRFICADCGSEVRLKPKDAVRCRECNAGRILYKKRTTKVVQVYAR